MSAEEVPQFHRDKFAVSQRRRVEALIVIRALFPLVDARTAVQLAEWIVTGRPDGRK